MITVNELVDIVLLEAAATNNKTSQHTYRWLASKCRESWDNVPIREVTKKEIQAWVYRRQKEVSASTLRSEISFLKRCFRAANDAGFDIPSPTGQVRTPKVNNQRERVLSPGEEDLIDDQMSLADFSVVQFALHTAQRRLEQFSLRSVDIQTWEAGMDGEIQLYEGMATIRTSKTGVGRKNPLNNMAAHIARQWQARKHEYLFYGDKSGLRWHVGNSFDKNTWRPALEAAGLAKSGLCWHSLRHTAASRSLQKGALLQDVQKLLGHKSITQTERYAHWSPESIWPAARALCKK